MAARKISTSSERETRDLVANIAQRGRRGYAAAETTAAPPQNLAAAAAATVAADPVDLNAAQAGALGAVSGAPAADTARYAEAQRAIFERGQGREAEYMGTRYGAGHDTQVEAINAALGKYDTELQEDAAARLAAQRSYGDLSDPFVPPSDAGSDYSNLPPGYNPSFELPLYEEASSQVSDTDFDYVIEAIEVFMSNGVPWATAAAQIRPYLIEQGLTPAQAINFLRGLQTQFSPETVAPNQLVGPGGNQMG